MIQGRAIVRCMDMKKWLIRSTASIAILAIFGFSFLYVASIHQRNRAQSFLREFASLQLGVSSFSDAQRLAQKYGGQPWDAPLRTAECTPQKCSFRFVFENGIFNHIQHKREISLAAGLTVRDGHVVSRGFDYSILGPALWSDHFVYNLSDRLSPDGLQSYKLTRLKEDEAGSPHWVKVELGPDAPEDLRRRAYSLNLACLAKLHGCDDLSAVLPKGL